jgi:hypothetical protein
MIDLSVITVTYCSRAFIEDQVWSVLGASAGLNYEHFVVDNGSGDGTGELIEERLGGQVTLIKNGENKGFSYANNQAVQRAKGKYILFLNPDMRIKEGSLEKLVRWMDVNPKVGLAGCKLVTEMGTLYELGLPRPFPKFIKEFLWLLRLEGLYQEEKRGFDPDFEQEVEMARGAFMLVRREVVDALGWGFDPRYFILYEDTDLCREVKRLGFKVVYNPEVVCVDLNSRSFVLQPSKWIYKEFSKSMQRYFQKWHPFYEWLAIAAAAKIGHLLRSRL